MEAGIGKDLSTLVRSVLTHVLVKKRVAMTEQPQEPEPQEKKLDNIPFIQMLYSLEYSTNQLEKTWSKGLDTEDVKKAHTELLTLWEAFRQNFPSWTEERSTKLQELGFDTIIQRYPLQDEDFKSLGQPLTLIDTYKQFSVASMYQVHILLRALTAIQAPSRKEIFLPSGKTESWWDAGAFSVIRASVRSLAFTLEQQTVIYEALTKEPHTHNARPAWMQYMDMLRMLLNNGLYEAAPPIAIGAIRFLLAARADVPVDKLPSDLATKLSHVESYDTLAHLYGQLEKVCQRIGVGAPPDRGYLVSLITGSAIQLDKLVSQPLKPDLVKELKA